MMSPIISTPQQWTFIHDHEHGLQQRKASSRRQQHSNKYAFNRSRGTPHCSILRHQRRLLHFSLSLLQCLIFCSKPIIADIIADRQGLITFMNAVDDGNVLSKSWQGDDPCNSSWIGVQCNKGRVWTLILESKQLKGAIPKDALSKLDVLRKLSLKDNLLSGNLPSLTSPFLRAIWLQNNLFEGSVFDMFSQTPRFNVLNLANNRLTGPIPESLALLPDLRALNLENNSLTGGVPAFNQSSLKAFNVSHNQLQGEIPHTYVMQHTFKSSSFDKNPGLCGLPLNTTCKHDPNRRRSLLVKQIVGIVVGDFVVLMLITLAFFWHYKRKSKTLLTKGNEKTKKVQNTKSSKQQKKVDQDEESIKEISTTSTESPVSFDAEKRNIVIVSSDLRQRAFELDDLLRASAELLGKGALGTSYKAVLRERKLTVVVKRFSKDFHPCGKKEFEQQAQLLGRLYHRNLVPLLAYYYSKDEKLFVYSYMPNSNLFSLLHGKRTQDQTTLDWGNRLRIAQSIACGLVYLHKQCKAQKLPHGNIKSSNILFDKGMQACLADYGIAPLMQGNACSPSSNHIVAYDAPEYLSSKKLSHKTDVYGFGMVLLELLTGKVPSYGSAKGEGVDLPQYVRSASEADWKTEVLDVRLGQSMQSAVDVEGAMSVLRLAMECVAAAPEERPKMSRVCKRIEGVRESSSSSESSSFPANASSGERAASSLSSSSAATAEAGAAQRASTPELST